MSRLMSVLLWSVLAAAFIGPGTVTTCALAGHDYGVSLGWALAFSVLACVVLQEAAARLAIVTGDDVGLALRRRFSGGVGVAIGAVVVGAVIVGCAAYEAGNILGAIAGVRLVVDVPVGGLAVSCAVVAAVLLWPGKTGLIATAMGALVTIMGVAFAVIAVEVVGDVGEVGDVARGLVMPSLPDGSALVVLGLVGTTVVPYNLFLGSGLARGQHDDVDGALAQSRFGIVVAVFLGGAVSVAIVVAGAATDDGPFSLESLQQVVVQTLGQRATMLLPVGLFCAGLSSAVTARAPQAHALGVGPACDDDGRREQHGPRRSPRSLSSHRQTRQRSDPAALLGFRRHHARRARHRVGRRRRQLRGAGARQPSPGVAAATRGRWARPRRGIAV